MISTLIPLDLLLWLPCGADGTDDDADTGDDNEQEDSTEENDGEEEKESPTVSREEFNTLQKKYDQMRTHLSNADKNKSSAQKKLEEIERQGRTDLENAQADVAKATKESEQWRDRFLGLARTNAFLIASAQLKVNWHDPEVAQASLKMGELEVGEDGTIDGINDLIKKLAKEKPFLVVPKENGDEDKVRSGSRVGGTGKKQTGAANALSPEALEKRFSALRQ